MGGRVGLPMLQLGCTMAQFSARCKLKVLKALSKVFREGLPMELLYVDDLVLIAETKELLLEKARKWKGGMEK